MINTEKTLKRFHKGRVGTQWRTAPHHPNAYVALVEGRFGKAGRREKYISFSFRVNVLTGAIKEKEGNKDLN